MGFKQHPSAALMLCIRCMHMSVYAMRCVEQGKVLALTQHLGCLDTGTWTTHVCTTGSSKLDTQQPCCACVQRVDVCASATATQP
jgi:hypothetical protein